MTLKFDYQEELSKCSTMEELTEGINTYHIKVIRLKSSNADELFSKLFDK